MKYTLNDIIQATGGSCSSTNESCSTLNGEVSGVVIDSRKISDGCLYIAFKGERVDGHDYVDGALKAGAAFALVERISSSAPHQQQILVDDCLTALQNLASYHRAQSNFKVVGITGSVGKTSSKEMLALAISSQVKVHATSGNYNNHIGMPLTLVNAPATCDIVVLEMGMNHAGEIATLSRIAKPDVAIITTIDAVHLEFFANVAGIAHAKAEIMEGMQAGGAIILPLDNPYYAILADKAHAQNLKIINFGKAASADFRLDAALVNVAGTRAQTHMNGAHKTISLCVAGEHLALNALAVLACVDAVGLNVDMAINRLAQFQDAKGRGNIHEIICNKAKDDAELINIRIIDETYNASPASMRSALLKLQALSGGEGAGEGERKIAVLGDMKELGENAAQFHAELSHELVACGVQALFCVGEMMQHLHAAAASHLQDCFHFNSNAELSIALINYLQGDDFILCKGSRSSHIEQVISAIKHYNTI